MPAAVHSATMVPLKPVPTQNRPPSPPPDDTLPRSSSTPFQPTHRRRGGGPHSSDGAARAPLLGMQVIQPAVARRQGGGKPLLEWISRKLGSRRASDAQDREAPLARRNQPVQSSTFSHSARNDSTATRFWRSEQPAQDTALEPYPTRVSVDTPSLADSQSMMSFGYRNPPSERRREANNPYPSLPIPLVRRSYPASTCDGDSRAPSMSMLSRSRTSSLRSLSSYARRHPVSIADDDSNASLYPRNADEDASLRPLPPSPTSMSIISRAGSAPLVRSDSVPHKTTPAPVMRRDTRSSSVDGPRSFMSDDAANLRGSREGSLASTKPTTIISFESGAPAHIAVAPSVSSSSPVVRPLSTSTGASGGGLAQSLPSPVSPTFLPANAPPEDFQVPKHTRYHPRNNPHPASAPGPNASTQTLASSTFGLDTTRSIPRPSSVRIRDSPSAYHAHGRVFAERPGSMQGDAVSTHAIAASVRTRGNTRADDDASMRAVRRRGSWESGESRWSWKPGAPGTTGVDNFSLLRRGNEDLDDVMSTNRSSVHTRDSYRTAITTWDDVEDEPSPLTPDTAGIAQAEAPFADAFAPPKAPMSVLV